MTDYSDIQRSEIWREMMSGDPFDALHPLLVEGLLITRRKVKAYNEIDPTDLDALDSSIREILGKVGCNVCVVQPFFCDYGVNIHVGDNFFANYNFTVLDEALVSIGDNVFIGPNVNIFTACHPLEAEERNKGTQWSLPVIIGNSCWIGGNVTILPGVTIGNNVTVGAGSVVTKDIPDREVWAGNPARCIKRLPQ